ncbi:MAG: hypothetical protein V5A68_05360 [Candidatus Thermoplasmatota archaeon]
MSSKKISFKIDEELFEKIKNHDMKKNTVVEKALSDFFKSQKRNEMITTLKQDVENLKKDKESILEEKENLEMNYVCLMNEKENLQSRIDDLVEKYPSASILLGQPPKEGNKSIWRTKLFKK